MDVSGGDEHRALHFAVLRRDPAMVRLLMEAGADARKGIYPHRDATSPWAMANDRGYDDVLSVIEDEERQRREEMSCPNATVTPVQDQIHAAIFEHDNETAIRLLAEDGSLIHACDRDGRNPLHIAAQDANIEMLAWLLERRAKVNKADLAGKTPLDLAAMAADPGNDATQAFPKIAQLLRSHGAQLTIAGAVALGDATRVREMVEAEPGLVRKITRSGGLLTVAVNHGQVEMVKLLLDLGADVDERVTLEEWRRLTVSWGAPLWYAALGNKLEIATLLLDRGADPNANVYASGWPLRNAWNHKDGALKNLLLERGARLQPYMVSETHDVAEARRLLASDTSEELAKELAWSAADHGCAEIVDLALPHLPWSLNNERWHWVLIQPIRGATSEKTNTDGHFSCMQSLLKHGINPNVARFGQTVLHFTAGYRGNVGEEDRARFTALLVETRRA